MRLQLMQTLNSVNINWIYKEDFMKKIWEKPLHSVSVLIAVITVILIFPLNLYNLYSADFSQKMILENTRSNMEGTAKLYMSGVMNQIKGINRYLVYLEENAKNLAGVCEADDWDSYYMSAFALRVEMQEHLILTGGETGYFFYVPKMDHGMGVESSNTLTQNQWMNAVFSDPDALVLKKWRIVEIEGTKWLLHSNFWRDIYLGAGIQLDSIIDMVSDNFPEVPVTADITTGDDINQQEDSLCVIEQCTGQDVYLSIQIAERDIVRNLPLLQRYARLIASLEFLVIPLILYLIHRLVIRPVRKVNYVMERLKTDPDIRIRGDTFTKEFKDVYSSFNDMADEIVELKINSYEHQLDKQRMEMKNLQLQVKPHFLFNTLNLMFNLIQMGEYKSVQQMLLYLSDYFRYINIGDNEFSRFADEYDLIVKYLDVSKIRYPGTFDYSCEISAEAMEVLVPQLLIHNFIENVIKHGLDLTRMNHIVLRAFCEGQKAVFQIEDDGVGMDPKQAENLNRRIFEFMDGNKHLGMRNSFRRLRFYYPGTGDIHVKSDLGAGTTITVTIPKEPEITKSKGLTER